MRQKYSSRASLLIQPLTSGRPFAHHISSDINRRLPVLELLWFSVCLLLYPLVVKLNGMMNAVDEWSSRLFSPPLLSHPSPPLSFHFPLPLLFFLVIPLFLCLSFSPLICSSVLSLPLSLSLSFLF